MKETKTITACVVDHGLFFGLALRLAKDFGRVMYYTPWERSFPKIHDCCIGDGYDEVERIDDFWPLKEDIDLFIFPDIQHAGLQTELDRQGFAVWGSHNGDALEMKRETFHRLLGELGLDVPGYEVIVGLTNLRLHLKDKEDKYLKVSKYRGNFETCHWRSWEQDEGMLDCFAVEFGPLKEQIRFMVVDSIKTDIEVGGDTFCINGQFPSHMVQGYEWKDKGFLASYLPTDLMPKQVQDINRTFAPLLKDLKYCNFWSTELRLKDDKTYFIDPCCRCPCPGLGAEMNLYSNLAEIIWHGANGILIEPESTANFAAEICLTSKAEKGAWHVADFPKELRPWLNVSRHCLLEDRMCYPPDENHGDDIGWLQARGNTIAETIQMMKEHVKLLPDGVSAASDALFNLLGEVHEAEKHGVEFTEQKVPEPETALEI